MLAQPIYRTSMTAQSYPCFTVPQYDDGPQQQQQQHLPIVSPTQTPALQQLTVPNVPQQSQQQPPLVPPQLQVAPITPQLQQPLHPPLQQPHLPASQHRPKPKYQKKITLAPPPPEDAAEDINDEDIANMPPSNKRPCVHNEWDDVRTRKGSKILRCRTCQRKWKLSSSHVPRCLPFLRGFCSQGDKCQLLHVHKKKSGLLERYEQFGDAVLRAMPPQAKQAAQMVVGPKDDLRRSSRSTDGSSSGDVLTEEVLRGAGVSPPQDRRASVATSISEPPSLLSGPAGDRRASLAAFSDATVGYDTRRTSAISEFDPRRVSVAELANPPLHRDRRCSNMSELNEASRAAIVSSLDAIKRQQQQMYAVTFQNFSLGTPATMEAPSEVEELAPPPPPPPPQEVVARRGSGASAASSASPPGSRKSSIGFPALDSRHSSNPPSEPSPSPTQPLTPTPAAAAAVAAAVGAEIPGKAKDSTNFGVHAMTEDELDAHMSKHFGRLRAQGMDDPDKIPLGNTI